MPNGVVYLSTVLPPFFTSVSREYIFGESVLQSEGFATVSVCESVTDEPSAASMRFPFDSAIFLPSGERMRCVTVNPAFLPDSFKTAVSTFTVAFSLETSGVVT